MNKALFLDRDGVINYDPGDYTTSLEEFHLLPTVMDALALAQKRGFILIIITNQGGIAKGLYTHDTVNQIHAYLKQECTKNNIQLTEIFYSPHHPDFSNSLTRKPQSLLIERALAKYYIDPAKSYMIGDRDRDLECAHQAGVKGIKIPVNGDLLNYVTKFIL